MCMLLVKRCSLDHRSEAMAGTATVWVKVTDGNSVKYPMDPKCDVCDLLEAVTQKCKLTVGVDKLNLYLSKDAFKGSEKASLLCRL